MQNIQLHHEVLAANIKKMEAVMAKSGNPPTVRFSEMKAIETLDWSKCDMTAIANIKDWAVEGGRFKPVDFYPVLNQGFGMCNNEINDFFMEQK